MNVYESRALYRKIIRDFFGSRDYLEIDTPILVKTPGTETYLRYFKTKYEGFTPEQNENMWLRSSPEIHMKIALASGLSKIFQIAPCFRNHGEVSEWHRPEFTMIEWYETEMELNKLIEQTEDLVKHCSQVLTNKKLSQTLVGNFTKISVFEVFKQLFGFELIDLDEELPKKLEKTGMESITANDDFESAFFKALLEKIEPHLAHLNFAILYDYPPSQAALSVVKNGAAKRFEMYIKGIEICNGFEELLDPQENILRFAEASAKRVSMGYETQNLDDNFVHAMEMLHSKNVPISGNALGFERVFAVLLGKNDIYSQSNFSNYFGSTIF